MRYDPLAPTGPLALRRQVSRDIAAQITPLARRIAAQTRSGARNISGIANALAGSLAGYQGQVGGIYRGAEHDLGQLDASLADRLGSSGGALAGDLSQRLALSGSAPSENIGALAHAAAGSGYARGGAERGMLIQHGAAAQEYASRLPGLARLAGVQQVGQRQAQGQSSLADLNAKTPGLIAQALADARRLEYEKGVANLGFSQNLYNQQAATSRTQTQQAGASQRSGASTSVAAQRARETARHNRVSEAEKARADAEKARKNRVAEKQRRKARQEQHWEHAHPNRSNGSRHPIIPPKPAG